MRTKVWVIAILVGVATLDDLPAFSQANTSQPVGYTTTRNIDCRKLSPDNTKKNEIQLPTELEELKKLKQQILHGNELNKQGKYQEAILLIEQALKALKTQFPNQKEELGAGFLVLGFAYQAQGTDKKAESMYLEMLKERNLTGKQKVIFYSTKDSSGRIVKQGGYEESIDNPSIFDNALCNSNNHPIYTFLGSRTTTEYSSVRDNNGRILPGQRATVYEDTGTVIVHPKKFDLAFLSVLQNLGSLYSRQNYYEWAHTLLVSSREHSIATISSSNMPGLNNFLFYKIIPMVNTKLASLFARFGKVKELNDLLERYDRFQLAGIGYIDSKDTEGFLPNQGYFQQQVFSSTFLALKLASNHPDKGLADRRALISWLRFKGLSLDGMTNSIQQCHQGSSPQITQDCNSWFEATRKLSHFIYREGNVNTVAEYERLTRQLDSAETRIRAAFYEARGALPLFTVDVPNTHKQIPKNAALVEIVLYQSLKAQPKFQDYFGEWRYAVAVLHPTGKPQWVDLGEATEIDAAIKQFRAALADQNAAELGNVAEVQQAAHKLDQQLMAKIRPLLGNAKHLLISADGELNLVPFEALRDETGQYLIHRYQFSYLTSGRDLLEIAEFRKNPQKPQQEAVILADPDYYQPAQVETIPSGTQLSSNEPAASLDSLGNFDRAPGTAELAQTLKSEIFPTAKLLTQTAATKTALQQFPSPRILVLATHGFFLPNPEKVFDDIDRQTQLIGTGSNQALQPQSLKIENPLLRSGLALVGSNRRNDSNLPLVADNGILTALEIAGLDLRGTQLVVLSACETGVGEAAVGDGVYGLRRALAIAGAQSQVLSLWKVDDTATKDLMVSYFKKMVKEGKGRHAALQAAKQEMLNNPKRRHPYYWASFIPSGDWTPLNE